MFKKNKLYPIKYFISLYPGRSLFSVIAIFVSGLAEVFSFAALIPLIKIALNEGGVINPEESGFIYNFISNIFLSAGVPISIGSVLFLIVSLMTVKSLLLFYSMREVGYICTDIEADFRHKISRFLINAEWKYLLNRKSGDLASIIGTQAQSAANVFRASSLVAANGIQIILFSLVSLIISVPVTLFAFLIGFLIMLTLSKYIKLTKEASRESTKYQGALLSVLIDGLKNIKTYKAMGLHHSLSGYLQIDIDKLAEMRKKIVLSGAVLKNFQEPVQIIVIAAALYFLTQYWEHGPEQLVVLILLFYRTGQRLNLLQVYYQQIATAIPPFWLVIDTIKSARNAEEEINIGSKAIMKKNIVFDNVYYSYGKNKVLKGVNVSIKSGDFVSIVGESGGGKTTLLDMILRFNTPDVGVIKFDDTPINHFSKKSLRSIIGYVQQETTLFHESIRNNLILGDLNISDEEIINVLKDSGAMDFVNNLPGKLDFIVGEHGGRLSGGQRQRIGIARALLHNPKILILDEPTSSLDKHTEKKILKVLANLHGKITIIAISHQQESIEASDRVLRISDGSITEERL